MPHCFARRAELHRAAVDLDAAGKQRVGADDAAHDLRSSRADEAGHADDLSGPDVDIDVREGYAAGAAHAQNRRGIGIGDFRVRRVFRDLLGKPFAGHQPDRLLLRQLVDATLADLAPVAHDDDPVGNLVDLAQPVAHQHNGDALLAQQADDAEQAVGFAPRQAGIRFVEEKDLWLRSQGAGDFHELPLRRRKSDAFRTEIGEGVSKADLDQKLFRFAFKGARTVDGNRAASAEPRQEDILGHRHRGDKLRLLMDDGYAEAGRGERIGQYLFLAVERDRCPRSVDVHRCTAGSAWICRRRSLRAAPSLRRSGNRA